MDGEEEEKDTSSVMKPHTQNYVYTSHNYVKGPVTQMCQVTKQHCPKHEAGHTQHTLQNNARTRNSTSGLANVQTLAVIT